MSNSIVINHFSLENVFIVAELSANHNQNIETAKKTIKAMAESGADAVKLQTYTPDTMTIDCNNEYFTIEQGTVWDGKTLYNLYQEAFTPWEWFDELKKFSEELGLIFFSSPFDKTSVDFLEDLNIPAYKVASFEITDLPLIEYIAKTGKPILISTGIATLSDIANAIDVCKKNGNNQIILLQCTSSYPAPVKEVNLLTMKNMKETFNVEVGLSDHTLGSDVSIAAVALGAKVIEKHFILNRSVGGPDATFSMEPDEFKRMVTSIRNIEMAMGKIDYSISHTKKNNRKFSRSLFVVEDIRKGELFTESNIRSIRPGYGLHPKFLCQVIGKKAKKSITKGTPLTWDLLFDS